MEPYPTGDPRLPHHCYPPKKLTPDELTKRTGTSYYKLDLDDPVASARRIAVMKLERNFKREDTFTLDAVSTMDFEEKLTELFEEIECSDDQARLITEGAAYFDVEGSNGDWIRVLCEYGDLIIIPAGRPHRMTTTSKNFVKIRRFFKDESD
uniref:1,2-dihydroxy-3-keto-5-methylthiopentene dioxygenase n=1 Tax=Acrobeloides nanus TaxID=290746 RepID=A0A914DUA2_9BILA